MCVYSQSQCRMADEQLWFLLKFCLHHWLLQAQPKLLWGKSGTSNRLKSKWIRSLCVSFEWHSSLSSLVQLEVLHLLSPNQTAELLLLPLPTPPGKDVVIDRVFDFLLESPHDRRLTMVLRAVVQLAKEVRGFVMTDYNNTNALTWTVKYKLFTFSGCSTLQRLQTCVSEVF